MGGGSTIACALFQPEMKLIVANAGDSHVVLCRNDKSHCLSETHNTTNIKERERIESEGGSIINNRVCGTHQVTRGLGDYRLKKHIIAKPYMIEIDIQESDKYLILGSDGVSSILLTHLNKILILI